MKDKVRIHREIVHIERAIPESWLNIAIYLLTFGKRGAVFKAESIDMAKYSTPESINCRCSIPGSLSRNKETYD